MKFITRNIDYECREMASKYPVVTILGPRQSGKTTLVKELFPEKPYISLEDPDSTALAKEDPRGFLARFKTGCIIDEIQRQPELLSYIQGVVDHTEVNGMFILTGSHQLALSQHVAQSLAGRTAILKLLPLSLAELQAAPEFNLTSVDEHIFTGGFPRIYKNQIPPHKFFRDYISTYIERDVRQIINIKDLSLFQKFLTLCAGRIGQVFNSVSFANDLGVSHHTVQNWLSILEASFIIFKIKPYHENFGKRIIKSPKLYFTDLGLACYLLDISKSEQIFRDPLRGALFENLIILEVLKNRLNMGIEPNLYYYRDNNGHEVDLILKSANKFLPIEIKSSATFNSSFTKELKYFSDLTEGRTSKGYIVYAGEQEQNVGDFELINFNNLAKVMNYFDDMHS